MPRALGRRWFGVLVTLATLAIAVAPVLAQDESNAPRQPAVRSFPAAWVGYFLMFVIFSFVVAVSLYPSKRGHQE